MIEKMNAMSQLHYDLKITTVTGIPMKVNQVYFTYTVWVTTSPKWPFLITICI